MNKVYIVRYCNYDSNESLGAFSNKEDAEEFIKENKKYLYAYEADDSKLYLEEAELNPSINPIKEYNQRVDYLFSTFYSVYPNGDIEHYNLEGESYGYSACIIPSLYLYLDVSKTDSFYKVILRKGMEDSSYILLLDIKEGDSLLDLLLDMKSTALKHLEELLK
jgi:hypothetical protein